MPAGVPVGLDVQPVMIAALRKRTPSGKYTSRCVRTPRRSVTIAKRPKSAAATQPPEIGPCVGRLGLEPPPDLGAVVNVSVVVTAELPGVTVDGENDPVVSGGRLEAEKVTGFGNPLLPGVT